MESVSEESDGSWRFKESGMKCPTGEELWIIFGRRMASFFSSLIRPPQSIPQTPAPQSTQNSPSSPLPTAQAAYGTTTNPLPELRTEDPLMLWQSLYQNGYCVLPGEVVMNYMIIIGALIYLDFFRGSF
jgi:hypothetical protein